MPKLRKSNPSGNFGINIYGDYQGSSGPPWTSYSITLLLFAARLKRIRARGRSIYY